MQSEVQNRPLFADYRGALSPFLCKPSQNYKARSVSESSEDFVVFERDGDECFEDDFEEAVSESDDNSDSELDTEDETEDEDESMVVSDDEDRLHGTGPRKQQDDEEDDNSKKVKFNLTPEVHTMVQWDYAYRAARKGPWEMYARDRGRFKSRIQNTEKILGPIFNSQHRSHVWQERFQPKIEAEDS